MSEPVSRRRFVKLSMGSLAAVIAVLVGSTPEAEAGGVRRSCRRSSRRTSRRTSRRVSRRH